MTITSDYPTKKSECRIAEIVQHTCHPAPNSQGMQCFPILRIFKLCKGKPAVEITKFVEIDAKDGGIEIPPGFKTEAIHVHPWREIQRYDNSGGLDNPQLPGSRPSTTE